METVRPRHTGFCFGVRDALELTGDALSRQPDTVALGQVVHNGKALEELEARGLRQAAELPLVAGAQVVVTAHGATPQLLAEARDRRLRVVDTTCPLVRRVQRHAVELREQGWPVVVVGHADHAEVRGVRGWAGEADGAPVEVVASAEEA
ncbi:MAG: bifunctional 4-hydroxy-3-methylbut-2-enyl diphosphate reductase/30S ribosomal protein S1, partial [Candidatus Dormibacteria bacterium]